MGVRREQPSGELSGSSITLRLPDGSVKTMPVAGARGQVTSDVCCFCGERVDQADSERVGVTARWIDERGERTQNWGAHRGCLAERMHERVSGTGPFFGE